MKYFGFKDLEDFVDFNVTELDNYLTGKVVVVG